MNKRRIACFTLSLLACASLNAGTLGQLGLPATVAQAATTSRQSATGLDQRSLQLINHGNWHDLIDHLQTVLADAARPDARHAWLAFAYMYVDKCDDLKNLADKTKTLAGTDSNNNIPKVVEVYSLICQKKFPDANELAQSLTKDGHSDDISVNMALAASYAKLNDANKSVEYLRQVGELAPDFAWGWRIMGFLQTRSLKDNAAAEQSFRQALAITPDFKEVRDMLVDLHVGRNDFDGAIDIAMAGIKANPRDPMNYYRLSQIYTQQWRLREADAQLDKAIRIAPDNAKFHRAKASILRFEGNLKAAIAEQQRAVDLSNDKPFELTELAALNELAGNDGAAADNLKQAISISPSLDHATAHTKLVQLYIKGQRWDDLVTEFRRAVQVQPQNANYHLGLADALIRAGKKDEAMKELRTAAELDNNDPRPHRVMGSLLAEQRDFAGAARAYTRALNINPGSVDDLVSLGFTYAQNDDYMQAETAFVTALALQQLTNAQGSRENVMRSLATLLLAEGRYTEATVNYEEILRSLKDNPARAQDQFMFAQAKALRDRNNAAVDEAAKAFAKLSDADKGLLRTAFVASLLRLGRADAAIEQLKGAPADQQKQTQWLTLAARAYRMKHDLKQAEDYANQAVNAKEDNKELQADAYTELAQTLLAKGDLNGADNAVRKATDLNGKSFVAYEVMGRIYLKRGDHEHAIEAAKRSLDINTYYTPAYMLIGDASLAANKVSDAVNNYKRAVELYPTYIDAHRSLREAYKKLAQKDDVLKEDELITQMEKNG
jgi:tetratricopeptide (TPR) repeat protein